MQPKQSPLEVLQQILAVFFPLTVNNDVTIHSARGNSFSDVIVYTASGTRARKLHTAANSLCGSETVAIFCPICQDLTKCAIKKFRIT
jgi:hypothetical protein